MKKFITAKTHRGKCGLCPKDIVPGDQYVRMVRHATEEERNDEKVPKFRMRGTSGPLVAEHRHYECHQAELARRREERNRKKEEEQPMTDHIAHFTIGTVNAVPGADRIDSTTVLACMAEEVYACNMANGWFDADRTFGDDIALLHSEVSEMLEAFRDGNIDTVVNEKGKPEGLGSEAADVLVRLLDTCKRHNIDLFAEWRRKLDYNWTRGHRHGGKAL